MNLLRFFIDSEIAIAFNPFLIFFFFIKPCV